MGISKCNVCKSRSRIRTTRHYKWYTQIYRVCINCGYSWMTYEVEGEMFKHLRRLGNLADKIMSEVEK